MATFIVLLTQNRHSTMRLELPDYFYLDILKTVKEEKLYAFDEHVSIGTLDRVHCQDENQTATDGSGRVSSDSVLRDSVQYYGNLKNVTVFCLYSITVGKLS